MFPVEITFKDKTKWNVFTTHVSTLGGRYWYSFVGNSLVRGHIEGEDLTDRQLLIAILQDVERKEGET